MVTVESDAGGGGAHGIVHVEGGVEEDVLGVPPVVVVELGFRA